LSPESNHWKVCGLFEAAIALNQVCHGEKAVKRTLESGITIISEFKDFLVVYKPSGLLSQAGRDPQRPNLETILKQEFPDYSIRLLSRLDRETSGLLVVSTGQQENELLDSWHKQNQKFYLASVEGEFEDSRVELKDYLKEKLGVVKSVRSGGKPSLCQVVLIEFDRVKNRSLLLVKLQTGRRHQIRVQLGSRGYPVEGDYKYGAQRECKFFGLQSHALVLSLCEKLDLPTNPLIKANLEGSWGYKSEGLGEIIGKSLQFLANVEA